MRVHASPNCVSRSRAGIGVFRFGCGLWQPLGKPDDKRTLKAEFDEGDVLATHLGEILWKQAALIVPLNWGRRRRVQRRGPSRDESSRSFARVDSCFGRWLSRATVGWL